MSTVVTKLRYPCETILSRRPCRRSYVSSSLRAGMAAVDEWPHRLLIEVLWPHKDLSMKKMFSCLMVGLALFAATTARADTRLDFGVVAPTGAGSISYSVLNGPLVASGITVDEVSGIDVPSNDLVVSAITGGILAFQTGNLTGTVGTSIWLFGGGGPITITGAIPTIPGLAASTTLLSGTVSSATVVNSDGVSKVSVVAFLNTVNASLASFYGLTGGPTAGYFGTVNLSFAASGLAPGTFTSTSIDSGDIVTRPVPEPATMAMTLTGLLFSGGYWLRRRRKGQ